MASLAERYKLLAAAEHDVELQRDLTALCSKDILFWFNNFAYTFNPRGDFQDGDKQYHLPFNLYPFQEDLVLLIQKCIRDGEGLLIKKSRDMGISWIVLLVFHYFWNFEEGSDLHCGSSKKEYVDKRGSKSTLFEKLRYNQRMQPKWMFPRIKEGRHDTECKFLNPANGNTITGEAAVPSFAMSQRYKAIMMDELARQPYGQLAYETATQSSDCIIGVYTPFGKNNVAYTLANSTDNRIIQLTA